MSLESTSGMVKLGTHSTASHNVTHGSCFSGGRGKGGIRSCGSPGRGGGRREEVVGPQGREGGNESVGTREVYKCCTTGCDP